MGDNYYDVEQIAQMLSIHPKTIQRYIREGKLRAVKIGKGWRISGHDLSKFTEETSNIGGRTAEPAAKERTKISSVIDLEVDGGEDAARIVNLLNAAMNVKPPEYGRASMQTQFLETENTLRIMLWGNIKFVSAVLNAVELFMDQYEEERKSE